MTAVNHDAIPAELRQRRQWVVWRHEDRNGKQTKVPYRADGGGRASSTDPATWATFAAAVAGADALAADGIGYVFSADDPYTGIDLDVFDANAAAIVTLLDSFTEKSQSGRGVHVIVRASLNGHGRNRKGPIEVYEKERFFVVTGDHMLGTPTTIEERQEQLDEVLARFLPAKADPVPVAAPTPVHLDDHDLLERARRARNGSAFDALYSGSWEGRYSSQSEADLALCTNLAFWTGRDPDRIDRMFRSSGLMRDKWNREDYRSRTITEAIAGCQDVYEPRRETASHTSDGHENSFVSYRDRTPTNESETPGGLPFAPLGEALQHTPDHVEWIWHGCVAANVKTLFASRPKTGKSTTTFGLLRALTSGEAFLGLPSAPTSVLLLSEEPAAALREKADRFGLSHSFVSDKSLRRTNEFLVHLLRRGQALGVTWEDVIDQAIAYATGNGIKVLVIDTLDKWAGFRGDDENKTGALLEIMEPLERAVAAGLAVLIITHHRKSGGEYGEAVRGGNALVGAVDVVLELERLPAHVDESRSGRVFRGISRFEDTPEEIVFRLEHDTFTVVGDLAQVKAQAELEQTVQAVASLGAAATADEVMPLLDLGKATALARLQRAHGKGRLARSGVGKKGDPYVFTIPKEAE